MGTPMPEITRTEAELLILALDDSSAFVRLAALRAIVRLPLAREVWLEISRRVVQLLQATLEGESFNKQTLEGIPYSEVIEAAVFVPTRAVRDRLHELLDAQDGDVRRAAGKALAQSGDSTAVRQCISELADPQAERRLEAAKYLSLLDASPMGSDVQEAYKRETDAVVRFWLAVALARFGEGAQIEEMLREMRRGTFNLREFWGDPTELTDVLNKRGPFPETVRDLLQRIAQEQDDFASTAAMDLYWAKQRFEVHEVPAPPAPPPADPVLEGLAEEVAKDLRQGSEPAQQLTRMGLRPDILLYLPVDLVPPLVTALFRDAVEYAATMIDAPPGNDIVRTVAALSEFEPEIQGLFECYQECWKSSEVERQWAMTWSVRWLIAWTVSRAKPERIVSELGHRLKAGDEQERVLAARLIEEATLYAHQHNPPQFGGGSAPADLAPRQGEFLDEPREDLVPANGGGKKSKRIHRRADRTTSQPRKRVVNTGFAPHRRPDKKIPPSTPLRSGEEYYFWLEIGEAQAESIEVTPTDIPSVPVNARLTVALFAFKDGIEIVHGADIGELEVRADGSVMVIRQPLVESQLESRYLKQRLFFPVRMPSRTGTFRMRCNIYWGQILLQSRVVHARVMKRQLLITAANLLLSAARGITGGKSGRALRSVLDYSLSRALNPAHLTQLTEHRLSVLLNNNGDGTHSLHFFGTDGSQKFKQEDVRFREGELHGMLTQARGTLRIVSWGNEHEWKEGIPYNYKDRQRDLPRLERDLAKLAKWGYEFYTLIRGRMAGGEDAAVTFENALLKPGILQIAMKESPSYVLPAALIYDYPLDVGARRYSLCPTFKNAFDRAEPFEDTECFRGNCPTRKDLTAICPSGFWGFRHSLGMPLSLKNAADVIPQITINQQLTVAMGVATDLQLLSAHAGVLQQLRPGLIWKYADSRDEVFSVLKESSHIVYFYCHGGCVRDAPYLQVGPKDDPGLIQRSNLYAYEIVWDAPHPLVFINGCHTTAVEPLLALEFISPLVTYSKSAGVIGTEITIFEELATDFAEECLRRFCAGDLIGGAIRGARLKLLGEGNPLGLVYIPFVVAGLKLVDRSAELDVSELGTPDQPSPGLIEDENRIRLPGPVLRKRQS